MPPAKAPRGKIEGKGPPAGDVKAPALGSPEKLEKARSAGQTSNRGGTPTKPNKGQTSNRGGKGGQTSNRGGKAAAATSPTGKGGKGLAPVKEEKPATGTGGQGGGKGQGSQPGQSGVGPTAKKIEYLTEELMCARRSAPSP